MKLVDLGEPTSFLDHVYWGCTQRECKPNEISVEEFSKMFESRISAGATERLPGEKNLTQKRLNIFLMNVEKCSNHESPPEQLKSYLGGRSRTRGGMILRIGE